MASTTPDRQSTTRPNGRPRIDESVFSTIGAVQAPISTVQFQRWFACLATGGHEE